MADKISYVRAASAIINNANMVKLFGKTSLDKLTDNVNAFFGGFAKQCGANGFMPPAIIAKLMQGNSADYTTKQNVTMHFEALPLYGDKQTTKQKSLAQVLCETAMLYQHERKKWQSGNRQHISPYHDMLEPEYMTAHFDPKIKGMLDGVKLDGNGKIKPVVVEVKAEKKPTEKPAEKPAEKPTSKAKSAEKPKTTKAEKPATKAVKKPVEVPKTATAKAASKTAPKANKSK